MRAFYGGNHAKEQAVPPVITQISGAGKPKPLCCGVGQHLL